MVAFEYSRQASGLGQIEGNTESNQHCIVGHCRSAAAISIGTTASYPVCAKHYIILAAFAREEGQTLFDYQGNLMTLLRRLRCNT